MAKRMSDNERDRDRINIVFALCRSSFTDEPGEWRAEAEVEVEVEGGEARDSFVLQTKHNSKPREKNLLIAPLSFINKKDVY